MRKFRHKITGDIAFELNSTDYYSLESDITKIPSKLVENSNDWEEIVEYPLSITDLKTGTFYTTEYENQGKYTFRQGCDIYYSHQHNSLYNLNGDFTNSNGFYNFREATNEEIIKLIPEYIKITREFNRTLRWWKVGHIYNVQYLKNNNLKVYHKELLDNSTSINNIFYVPATKEEYDAQFVKKDYEILSFKSKFGNEIYTKNEDSLFTNGNIKPSTIEEMLDINKTNIIYSVKRLYDGEIFTIGDKVMYENSGDIFIINYFTFYDKKQTKIVAGNSIATDPDNSDWSIINTLIKYKKQPLFKTEDGVDIYENDEYYCTNHQYNLYGPFKGVLKFNVSKTFSTKKGAEAYIIMNKPCLSYKELTERDFIKPCNRNTLLEWIKAKL